MQKELGLLGLGVIVSIITVGCATAPEVPEEEGASSSSIQGGETDTQTNALVFVRSFNADGRSWQACSGTLIAPRVVLTAAHCAFDGNAPRTDAEVSFSPQPSLTTPKGGTGYRAGRFIANPKWDHGHGNGQDVAAVVLAQPVTDIRPAGLGPAPAVGTMVVAGGYGRVTGAAGANDGTGTRRVARIPVNAVSAHEITAGSDGLGTCHGDSGGPLVANGLLVGTVSYGDTADCRGASHFTRIDDARPFIDDVVAKNGGGASGANPGAGSGTQTAGGGGGGGARASSGSACCVNGEYFDCPDTAACFGGFDVNACIDACNDDFQCTMKCLDKMGDAKGPTSACQRTAPPPGVTCGG